MFKYLLTFLNILEIGVSGFLIGFTSAWASNTFTSTQNLLILVSIFEVLIKKVLCFQLVQQFSL
jgi:hypothetical protein